jgi:hypothetical protein
MFAGTCEIVSGGCWFWRLLLVKCSLSGPFIDVSCIPVCSSRSVVAYVLYTVYCMVTTMCSHAQHAQQGGMTCA